MKKVYISKTGTVYAFPVTIKKDDKTIHPIIQFGNDLKFETSTKEVQESIEASDYYKSGKIELLSTEDASNDLNKSDEVIIEPVTYEHVKTLQDAAEVLKKEPYNIPHQALRTPEAIAKHANSLQISFPNLKLD